MSAIPLRSAAHNDIPFASNAAEAMYQQALKDGVRITRDQVRRMLQAFDIEHGVHEVSNTYQECKYCQSKEPCYGGKTLCGVRCQHPNAPLASVR